MNPEGVPFAHLMESVLNATDACISARDIHGRYLLVNDRYCAASGLSRDQIIGRTPPSIRYPGPDRASTAAHGVVVGGRLEQIDWAAAVRDVVPFLERPAESSFLTREHVLGLPRRTE